MSAEVQAPPTSQQKYRQFLRPAAVDGRPVGPADERRATLQRGADRGQGHDAEVRLPRGPSDGQGMPGRVVSNVRRRPPEGGRFRAWALSDRGW